MLHRSNRVGGGFIALAFFSVASAAPIQYSRPTDRPPVPVTPQAGLNNPRAVVKSADTKSITAKPLDSSACATRTNQTAEATIWVTDAAFEPHCWNGCASRFIVQELKGQKTRGRLIYTGQPC